MAIDPLISAAMTLVAEKGWRNLSLADIALKAGLPLPEVAGRIRSKSDLLGLYAQEVDRHMISGEIDPAESLHDRLFDLLMRRFDAMSGDRSALSTILSQSLDDPKTLVCRGWGLRRSLGLALEAAGLSSSGLCGAARLGVLTGVYLRTLKTFFHDESPDLSATMATLDKALRKVDQLARMVRGKGASSPASTAEQHEETV